MIARYSRDIARSALADFVRFSTEREEGTFGAPVCGAKNPVPGGSLPTTDLPRDRLLTVAVTGKACKTDVILMCKILYYFGFYTEGALALLRQVRHSFHF